MSEITNDIEERIKRAEKSIQKKYHNRFWPLLLRLVKSISSLKKVIILALGHHFDYVIETILMSMLYGGQIQSMMPKLHSTNFEWMELIRPMYLVREEDICAWRDYNELRFLQCVCHFTETCGTIYDDGSSTSKRLETKKLIAELKKTNPFAETNIFRSVENVHVDTIIEYKKNGVRHNFLDEYWFFNI